MLQLWLKPWLNRYGQNVLPCLESNPDPMNLENNQGHSFIRDKSANFIHFCCNSQLVLDEFDRHYQATVHFPLAIAVDKSRQHRNNFSGMTRIKPRAAGLESSVTSSPTPPQVYNLLHRTKSMSMTDQTVIFDIRTN